MHFCWKKQEKCVSFQSCYLNLTKFITTFNWKLTGLSVVQNWQFVCKELRLGGHHQKLCFLVGIKSHNIVFF